MSSPNHPYKSRLFNWLNRQYIRLSDRLGTNLRHLQVTAKWGVQLLLYPLYFLVQTARMAQKQIGKKTKTSTKLPSANSRAIQKAPQDIEKVLRGVKPLVAEVINNNYEGYNTAISAPLTPSDIIPLNHNSKLIIRGIATFLDTKEIVVVTKENNILPIFSDEQQEKIKDIVDQVLKFQQRELVINKPLRCLPKIKYNNPNIIKPIREFWHLMAWIQDSRIARRLNIFGESYLALNISSETSLVVGQSSSLNHGKFRGYVLDIQALMAAAIAYFFGQQKNTIHGEVKSSHLRQFKQINLLSNAVKPTTQSNLNFLRQKIHGNLSSSKRTIGELTDEPDPFQIRAIVQAVIDYFLGDSFDNRIDNYNPNRLNPSFNAEEWLSPEDIFVQGQGNNIKQQLSHSLGSKVSQQHKKKNKPQNKNRRRIEAKDLPREISSKEIVYNPQLIQEESVDITARKSLEDEQETLETQATLLGYEQHFLEKILGWLDQILLWLEDFLIKIWRWLKSL
jgi:hypothetical protein